MQDGGAHGMQVTMEDDNEDKLFKLEEECEDAKKELEAVK